MQFELGFDERECWVWSRLSGVPALEDYLRYNDAVANLVVARQTKLHLGDHRGVLGGTDVPTDFIRRLVQWMTDHRDVIAGASDATVVQTSVHFGLTRMWESLVELKEMDYEHRVFVDLDEARGWLRTRRALLGTTSECNT